MEELLTYVTGVAHIGIAVPSIEEARDLYALLGFTPMQTEITYEQTHGVQAFMMRNGDMVIELLAPLEAGKESPVDSYIATKPYKMYHVGYYTSDFDAQVALLKKNKFIMTAEPKPSAAQGGRRTVFLASRRLGVVELVEA
ncbi:MAG: VOC family protein [Clostridia bacterium]|nr:VOC family protein [Clostridia bacterium]